MFTDGISGVMVRTYLAFIYWNHANLLNTVILRYEIRLFNIGVFSCCNKQHVCPFHNNIKAVVIILRNNTGRVFSVWNKRHTEHCAFQFNQQPFDGGQWWIIEAFVWMPYCYTGRSLDCLWEAGVLCVFELRVRAC